MADQEQNKRESLRQKLAESKARRAEKRAFEAKMRSEGRLPPGQRITQNFPVNHLGRMPDIDLDTWTFKICLLYTSPSPRDQRGSRMPSSA